MWGTWLFVFLNHGSPSFDGANYIYSNDALELKSKSSSLEPLPEERISPITLKNKCENGIVIEWQDDLPSEEKVAVINDVCSIAVNNFGKFLKTKKIISPQKLNLKFSLSLLNRGYNKRQMNDPERFSECNLPKDSNGKPYKKYGYYHFETNHIFVINEVFEDKKPNVFFKMLLAHELFHALTHQNNLFEKMPYPEYDSNEIMAREFTSFLGFGQ